MVDDFLGEWQAWRQAREERLTAPHGFLSITGLHWLGATPQRIDGVPGDRPADDAVGEVSFTVAGEPARLVAYDDDGGLWLVFADVTSGRATYTAGRQLVAPPPSADGTVVLDFNRTTNLPCAYTEFTTCPVPLPQNRLTVAIEAGEKIPV